MHFLFLTEMNIPNAQIEDFENKAAIIFALLNNEDVNTFPEILMPCLGDSLSLIGSEHFMTLVVVSILY